MEKFRRSLPVSYTCHIRDTSGNDTWTGSILSMLRLLKPTMLGKSDREREKEKRAI